MLARSKRLASDSKPTSGRCSGSKPASTGPTSPEIDFIKEGEVGSLKGEIVRIIDEGTFLLETKREAGGRQIAYTLLVSRVKTAKLSDGQTVTIPLVHLKGTHRDEGAHGGDETVLIAHAMDYPRMYSIVMENSR